MRILPLLCTVALGGCDGEEEEDRQTTILGLEGDAAAGEAVFAANCGTTDCHGPDGSGGVDAPAPGPPMPLTTLVQAREDDAIVRVMLDGLGNMTSQADLSDQQLADVLAYVNETFGP
jgi:mono/diheme cytochrome c family protein